MFLHYQKVYKIIVAILVVISTVETYAANAPNILQGKSVIKVKRTPYIYDYPTFPPSLKNGTNTDKPWKVYSDRENNIVFSSEDLHSQSGKIAFLDSFYVKSENKDALELVRCVPALVGADLEIKDPSKMVIVGWIDKDKLILSEKSLLDINNRRPLKYVAILNGNSVVDALQKHVNGQKIKCYPQTDISEKYKEITFGDIVYVYKYNKNMVLVGSLPNINTKTASQIIKGWVDISLINSWGQRLCLEIPESQTQKSIYLSRDSVLRNGSKGGKSFYLTDKECTSSKIYDKIVPVISFEAVMKNKDKFSIVKTGAVLNILDRRESFVYNVNGLKLTQSDYCDIISKRKNVNIIYVLNAGQDVKEYMFSINSALYEFSEYLKNIKQDQNYKFGIVECKLTSIRNVSDTLTKNYEQIAESMANLLKNNLENKASATLNTSLINGLSNALRLLKGKEEENNIIVIINSVADKPASDLLVKTPDNPVLNELGLAKARMVFIQPFCGSSPAYAGFVQQAKQFIKLSAEKSLGVRKNTSVGNEQYKTGQNNFRPVITGLNNIYCLDIPDNATHQGVLVFPTLGNKLESKVFVQAMDSVITQINYENDLNSELISTAFNSTNAFNSKTNMVFKNYYSPIQFIPADFSKSLKNNNYAFFTHGYFSPELKNPLTQTLFLSSDEYEELVQVFKDLRFDLISNEYGTKERNETYQAILQTLRRYSDERQTYLIEYCSFSEMFYQIAGHKSQNAFLMKYKVADLMSGNSAIQKDMKQLVEHIKIRIQSFNSIRSSLKSTFDQNGQRYYLVSEKFLP